MFMACAAQRAWLGPRWLHMLRTRSVRCAAKVAAWGAVCWEVG